MSATIAYILCSPAILAGLTMTGPDPESIWLFFGPPKCADQWGGGFYCMVAVDGRLRKLRDVQEGRF